MFDFLAHSPLGFWLVALLLVVFDSSFLLTPDKFTFTFEKRLNVKLRIVESPYLLRHMEPIITLFSYPLRPFFISSLDQPCNRAATKRILLQHRRVSLASADLSAIALMSLTLVCFVGPLASLQFGIGRALIVVMPAIYVCAFYGAAIIYFKRTRLGFTRRDIAMIIVELLICPVLIANIYKKIARRQPYACTTDLLNYFLLDPTEGKRRLEQHLEATAK